MDDVGRAALQGGGLGAAAGAAYGVSLGLVVAVDELDGGAVGALAGGLLVGGIATGVAVLVGFTAGVLLGAACLPLVRRVPVRVAAAAVVLLVGGAGLVAFPQAVLGGTAGGGDLSDRLVFTVLPALLAATAAGRHVRRLARWA